MAATSLHLTVTTAISFVCFALSCAAAFIPIWGYFEDANGGFGSDRGYFGPWSVCKELTYNREKCGSSDNVSRFRRSHFVLASGILIVISAVTLGIYFILAVMQVMKCSTMVKTKLVLSLIGGNQSRG